jgi:iron complex outermembrane recepter protein
MMLNPSPARPFTPFGEELVFACFKTKTIKVMNKPKPVQKGIQFLIRVTLIQIIVSSFSVATARAGDTMGQAVLERKITINVESTEFKRVLMLISKQAKVKFAYSPELVEADKRVSLHVEDQPLAEVLGDLLTPEVSFKVIGKQIVLVPASETLVGENAVATPTAYRDAVIRITGTVRDAASNPLPGVNVLVKGTTNGTTTDGDGGYSIEIGSGDVILVFSFIGYASQEVAVNNRTSLDVVLEEDITSLNEVVVTALGISREKKALGYGVSTVSAEQLTAAGNTNFASALYGKAAGVRITTAPGGATSAVNVQIRGINSISAKNNQPLYVVDGVMIRNLTSPGINNGGYWDDQKIRGNGILDVNPADIESLTILKGASAAALYGSEASNGVIVITTKKGTKGGGIGVEANYTFNVEKVAFTPKFQNTYGPGYDRDTNMGSFGANEDGFIPTDVDGDGVNETVRPIFRAWAQFGPKMDGREVAWWDGTTRKYQAQPDNYKDFYQTGHNSSFNVSLSNNTDKGAYRLSYTRLDYTSIAPGSNSYRNTFNLNSTLKLHPKLSTDIVVNYVNNFVHNRPESINRLTANYGGFFSRADDMSVYYDKYQTSQGFKYVTYNQTNRNPEEAIKYNIRAYDLLEYLWRNVRDTDDEKHDRILTSLTLNYDVLKNLKLRARFGNDFTGVREDIMRHNEYPVTFNGTNSTGSYTAIQNRYSILYSDVLLTYSKEITSDFKASVTGGFQSRNQDFVDQSSGTRDGLLEENWFSLNNSYNANLNTSATHTESLMFAYLGTLSMSFKEYLFVEATARQEYHSTLPPGNNSYFYPSINSGFVFTDAFSLPEVFSFGKLRASYASVSNPPVPYQANVSYAQTVLSTTQGSVPELRAKSDYGNETIKPERKYETEMGIELRMFQNKIGIDAAVYSNKVVDQIIPVSLPRSTGALSRLENLGELRSKGIEISLTATPFDNGTLRWDTRLNFAKNQTRVEKLVEGMTEMISYNGDAGAVQIKAEEGEVLGNIYTHPRETDDNGNYIIGDDGLYKLSTEYTRVGNIQPKAIGGWSNTLSYKGFALDFLMDYRFGGKLVSPPLLYSTGAGMYENSMKYRDEANGGLPYNIDGGGNKVLVASHADAQFHDGVILKGVTSTGEENATIVDAANYYINTFYWASGLYEEGAVFKNDYIKMREVTLSYMLPSKISDKLKFQSIRVSLIGRNLFYLYRTLDNLDPEAPIGSDWLHQGLDEGSLAATRSYGFSINARF